MLCFHVHSNLHKSWVEKWSKHDAFISFSDQNLCEGMMGQKDLLASPGDVTKKWRGGAGASGRWELLQNVHLGRFTSVSSASLVIKGTFHFDVCTPTYTQNQKAPLWPVTTACLFYSLSECISLLLLLWLFIFNGKILFCFVSFLPFETGSYM